MSSKHKRGSSSSPASNKPSLAPSPRTRRAMNSSASAVSTGSSTTRSSARRAMASHGSISTLLTEQQDNSGRRSSSQSSKTKKTLGASSSTGNLYMTDDSWQDHSMRGMVDSSGDNKNTGNFEWSNASAAAISSTTIANTARSTSLLNNLRSPRNNRPSRQMPARNHSTPSSAASNRRASVSSLLHSSMHSSSRNTPVAPSSLSSVPTRSSSDKSSPRHKSPRRGSTSHIPSSSAGSPSATISSLASSLSNMQVHLNLQQSATSSGSGSGNKGRTNLAASIVSYATQTDMSSPPLPTKPSQFSTTSYNVAKQFLHEDADADDEEQQQGGVEVSAKKNTLAEYSRRSHSPNIDHYDDEDQPGNSGGNEANALLSASSSKSQSKAKSMFQSDDLSEYEESMTLNHDNDPHASSAAGDWDPADWRTHAQQVIANAEQQTKISGSSHKQAPKQSDGEAKSIFDRRQDLRSVDQTVNLMDASMGDYNQFMSNGNNKGHNGRNNGNSNNTRGGGFLANMQTSLVDIWLDERGSVASSTNTFTSASSAKQMLGLRKVRTSSIKKRGRRSGGGAYRERTVCQDLFCSKFTILLICGGLVGAFVAWRTGAFWHTEEEVAGAGGNSTFASNDNPFNLDEMETFLITNGISTQDDLLQESSPQYLAHYWITHLEDPALLLDPSDPAVAGENVNSDRLHPVLVEAYVMAVLYYSTNGYLKYNTTESASVNTIWQKNTNWMHPRPICNWFGIDCEGERHVVHLNLTRNNLKGPVPRELRALTDLRTLDLSWNGLTTTLPDEVFLGWRQLEYLWLHKNKLSGTLATTVGSMTNLLSLQAYKNKLEGALPAELDNCTNLQTLALQENSFTGSIPYLAKLSSLQFLQLHDNKLSQHVPFEIFRLKKMLELNVGKNHLTGTIPPEISTCVHLRVLAVDSNEMEGKLPDVFHELPELVQLRVQNNRFEGTIPSTMQRLTKLEILDLDNNQFTGEIIPELGQMTNLKEFRAYRNSLSGSLPNAICQLKENHDLEFLALDCEKVTDCNCCDECL